MSGYETAATSWERAGRGYLAVGDMLADAVDRLYDRLVAAGQCFGSDGFVGRPAYNGAGESVGFRVARDDLLARLVLVVNLVRAAGHGQIVTGVNYQDAENASATIVAGDIQRAQDTLAKVAKDDVYQLKALPDNLIRPIPTPGPVRTALGLLEMFGLQCEWADGHSDKVAEIHDALRDVSDALDTASTALTHHTSTVVTVNSGETTDAFTKNRNTGQPGTPDWLTRRSRALGGEVETWARDLPADQRVAVEDVLAPDGIKRLNDGLHSDDPQIRAEAAAREQAAKEALGPFKVDGDTTVYAHPADDHVTELAAGKDVTVESAWSGSLNRGPDHVGPAEVVFNTRNAVDVSDLVGRHQVITWSDTRAHVLAVQNFPPEERIGTREPERRIFLTDLPARDAPPRAVRHLKALSTDLSEGPPSRPSFGLPDDYWEFRDKIAVKVASGELYKVNPADALKAPLIRPLEGVHDFGISGGSVAEFLRAHGLEAEALDTLTGNYRGSGRVLRSVTPLDDGIARSIANESLTPVIYPTGDTWINPKGEVHLRIPDGERLGDGPSWRIAVPDPERIPSMPGRLGDDGIRRFDATDDVSRYGHAHLGPEHFSDISFDDLSIVSNYQRTSWPYNTVLRIEGNGGTRADLNEWWDGIAPGAPLALFDHPMNVHYHSIIFSDDPKLGPLRRDLLASESPGERLQY
ncbi:hypothetical protein [Actinoallomurus acaciae]|uniref:Uncharacterized protein n=1 Tax=Actinoallomurus acaciae TaxID=502577 RepID=A0ABV5YMR3_9ACTN